MALRTLVLIALLLPLPALLLPQTVSAEIYKTVDEHGNVVYTDNPKGKKAEEVKLQRTNIQPPVKVTSKPASKPKRKQGAPGSYTLSINSPSDGSHIPPGQR